MRPFTLSIVLLLLNYLAVAQETLSGEFELKSTNDFSGLMLEPEYRIAVDGGAAIVKFNKDGKARQEKAVVSLAIFDGIDPATRKPAQFSGYLRIEVTNSGWDADKFVTRFDIPLVRPQAKKPSSSPGDEMKELEFALTGSAEVLWVEVLDNGITRYLDPMRVRTRADYAIKVIKHPFKGSE